MACECEIDLLGFHVLKKCKMQNVQCKMFKAETPSAFFI